MAEVMATGFSASNCKSPFGYLKFTSQSIKLSRESSVPTTSPVQILHIQLQMAGGNVIDLDVSERDCTIGDLKGHITVITKIPRYQQMLKIAGKPDLVVVDHKHIIAYNDWNFGVLNMVLISADFHHICIHYCSCLKYSRGMFRRGPIIRQTIFKKKEVIIKVNVGDTIKEVKKQSFAELGLVRPLKGAELFFTKSIQHHLIYNKSIQVDLPDYNCDDYAKLITGNEHQKLSEDSSTLKEYDVVMFHHLLKLRVFLSHIKDDGVKHVYSVEKLDDLDTSHNNPDDCLLSVQYDITVNKLYTMVAQHYKISMWHIVLTVNGFADNDTILHKVLCSPVIIYEDKEIPHEARCNASLFIFSEVDDCHNPSNCQLAIQVERDPIIKFMVAVRNDSWDVIINIFNIADEIKKEIEENSEDDCIRCMDVMHRMYHHDDHLTWDFVEIQVRREDPQLADTIRAHL